MFGGGNVTSPTARQGCARADRRRLAQRTNSDARRDNKNLSGGHSLSIVFLMPCAWHVHVHVHVCGPCMCVTRRGASERKTPKRQVSFELREACRSRLEWAASMPCGRCPSASLAACPSLPAGAAVEVRLLELVLFLNVPVLVHHLAVLSGALAVAHVAIAAVAEGVLPVGRVLAVGRALASLFLDAAAARAAVVVREAELGLGDPVVQHVATRAVTVLDVVLAPVPELVHPARVVPAVVRVAWVDVGFGLGPGRGVTLELALGLRLGLELGGWGRGWVWRWGWGWGWVQGWGRARPAPWPYPMRSEDTSLSCSPLLTAACRS